MALKSSQNKFTSPNKSDDNNPNENQRDRSSQNSQEFKKRTKSFKKRNLKKSLNNSSTSANSRSSSRGRTVGSRPLVTMAPPPVLHVPAMNMHYRNQNFSYPVSLPNWNIAARMRFQNPSYRCPFYSVPVLSSQMLPPMCPYPGGYTYRQPAVAPMPPPTVIIDEYPSVLNNYPHVYSPEQVVPHVMCEPYYSEFESVDHPPFYEIEDSRPHIYGKEFNLPSPRKLFPKAMMLSLDPNPIIDSFCKYTDVLDHASWIMDLEFGMPREPTTRTIAIYDVKYNSVHCKNSPNAIHPGFERCHPEFKSVLTQYYDCVVSTWYRGYNLLNQDGSVEDFQSWLSPLMLELGMCWP